MHEETQNTLIDEAATKWLRLVDIGWRIRKKRYSYSSILTDKISQSKISQRQFKILAAVEFAGVDTVSALASTMGLSKSTLSIITAKMIKNGYIKKKRPTITQDKRQIFLSVTDKGIEILKAQTDINIESFRVFYDGISTEQRETFRKGVTILREVLPKPPECTETLVKKYIASSSEDYDDEFMSVIEDLSFFAFGILEKNAKEYSSVLGKLSNELKTLTEHQLQLVFCISVMGINTVSALSEFLKSSNSTLSIAISKLVEEGYLKKIYPEAGSDGRYVYISPTEKTKALLEKTHTLAEQHIRLSFLNNLTTEKLEKFILGMDYFLEVFKSKITD